MTNKPSNKSNGSDYLASDNPPQEKCYLKCDNDRAARLALYAT
jgi:hypothetical protein